MGLKELVVWVGVPAAIICCVSRDQLSLIGAAMIAGAYWCALYLFDRPAISEEESIK